MSARFWGLPYGSWDRSRGSGRRGATASPYERLRDVSCTGCLAAWPAGIEPVPLLVPLHGDGQSLAKLFAKWKPAALSRGVAVLAMGHA